MQKDHFYYLKPLINRKYICRFLILSIMFYLGGCKKFIEVDPPNTGIVSTSVYESDASASAVLTGIYSRLVENPQGIVSGNYSIGYLCGLSADELTNYSADDNKIEFYTNALTTSRFNYFWNDIYQQIYVANAAIEGIENSKSINSLLKEQLLGEAYFARSFLYFYGVNLFGDIPLLLSSDYRSNNVAQRSSGAIVYNQIVNDLNKAKTLLTDAYRTPSNQVTNDRVRPNRMTAAALLARVYLFQQKWKDAEEQANSIISASDLYQLSTNLENVFLKETREAIWQMQSVYPGANTFDGNFYVLLSPPGSGQYEVSLSSQLLGEFEPSDKRLKNWIGSFTADSVTYYYYPNKYKAYAIDESVPVTEYTVVFRLAEQYLIRAEARAQQGNVQGGIDDLNVIRSRAGLTNSTAGTKEQLLNAIYHERQVELFTEWGHRWLDLKRTGLIDKVMPKATEQKGGTWNTNKQLFPIPLVELQRNSHLTQNNGY